MYIRNIVFALGLILWSVLSGCNLPNSKKIDYVQLPAFTENGTNAVIENPAGTNTFIKFDPQTDRFIKQKGANQVIDFLPFAANYGFIPGTKVAANGETENPRILLR